MSGYTYPEPLSVLFLLAGVLHFTSLMAMSLATVLYYYVQEKNWDMVKVGRVEIGGVTSISNMIAVFGLMVLAIAAGLSTLFMHFR